MISVEVTIEAPRDLMIADTPDRSTAANNTKVPRRRIPASYLMVLGGMTCRALLQAAVTVLAARALRPDEYGASVAIAGIAGFLSVWAGMGAPSLHLRDNAKNPERWESSYVRHYARVMLWEFPLVVLSVGIAWYVTNGSIGWINIVLLVSGELLGAPAADLLVRSYQGRSKYVFMSICMCGLPLARLSLLAALLVSKTDIQLFHWAAVVCASGCVVAASAFGLAVKSRRQAALQLRFESCPASGMAFAVGAASSRVHADADKVILARMSSMATAGEYSLAYRFVDVLLLPVSSLIEWSTRAMFQHGESGTGHAVRVLKARWIAVAGISLVACVFVYALAPYLWLLFGRKYESLQEVARWLALLPLTFASWSAVRSIASTTGRERLAAATESGGALLNVALCLLLVASMDWRGAVLATYLTHLAMTSVVLVAISRSSGRLNG